MREPDCAPFENYDAEWRHQQRQFVEPNRRLVTPNDSHISTVNEFIDTKTGERQISIPVDSSLVPLHRELAKRRIPVFPIGEIREGHVLLDTPADARLLSGSLRFIARDVLGYRPIFEQVGEMFARCQSTKFGLPVNVLGRTVLEGVAISNSDEVYGSSVYLVPPYNLDISLGKQDAIDALHQELTGSNHFTEPAVTELISAVNEGWNALRS